MKKLFTLFLFSSLFLGLSNITYAQEDYSALNVFIRFGNNSKINAHYEIPVTKNITISPSVVLPFNFDYVSLGGRADYYFDSLFKLQEPWDIWGGVDAGFIVGGDSGDDDFSLNLHAGVEYKITETFGIIGEFGGGTTSFGGIGVGIHF